MRVYPNHMDDSPCLVYLDCGTIIYCQFYSSIFPAPDLVLYIYLFATRLMMLELYWGNVDVVFVGFASFWGPPPPLFCIVYHVRIYAYMLV